MKLIVQIPAFNEEKTIRQVIESVPKKIKGVSNIQILLFDDGSTDNTVKIAREIGIKHIYKNRNNLGLGITFKKAISASLSQGADIIVNVDADNQYDQSEIEKLIKPILEGKADLVTGDRQIEKLHHMPSSKKIGNIIGSFLLRVLTNIKIKDVSCGFRAYSKDCAKSLNIISEHTYTHETLIQAAFQKMIISEIPIKFKKRKYGKSRLIGNVIEHIIKSSITIVRAILMYRSYRILVSLGFILILFGFFGIIRFMIYFLSGNGDGHIQSLILSSIFIGVGVNTLIMGIIADLISINRRLINEKIN